MSSYAVLNISEIEAMKDDFRAIKQWDNGAKYPVCIVGHHYGRELMAALKFDDLEVALLNGEESFEKLKNEAFELELKRVKSLRDFEFENRQSARNLIPLNATIKINMMPQDFTIHPKKAKKGRFSQRFLTKINKKH